MPITVSVITDDVAARAAAIGAHIRTQRKALRVSATTAARAAGMSRVTWYRLEKGEPSVTLGSYLSALAVLNIDFPPAASKDESSGETAPGTDWIPVRIALADYPQLRQLAWQIHGVEELSPREALEIYERNWKYLDPDSMEPREQHLIEALRQVFAAGGRDV